MHTHLARHLANQHQQHLVNPCRWMSFWMCRAALEAVMPLLALALGWTRLLPELHLAVLLWLALPQTQGALLLWRRGLLPAVLLGRGLLVRSGVVKDQALLGGGEVRGAFVASDEIEGWGEVSVLRCSQYWLGPAGRAQRLGSSVTKRARKLGARPAIASSLLLGRCYMPML
jgi:hypothetical protein